MLTTMKKICLGMMYFSLFVITISVYAQQGFKSLAQNIDSIENEKLQAQFISDVGGIMEYIGYNLDYPKEAIKAGVNIKVVYSFIVEADGTVNEIKWHSTHVEKDSKNPEVIAAVTACNKVAYDFIKSTSRMWKPAKISNLPVKTEMTLPIWFKLH